MRSGFLSASVHQDTSGGGMSSGHGGRNRLSRRSYDPDLFDIPYETTSDTYYRLNIPEENDDNQSADCRSGQYIDARSEQKSEVALNLECTERLIMAIESLRGAIESSGGNLGGSGEGAKGVGKRGRYARNKNVSFQNATSLLGTKPSNPQELLAALEKLKRKNEKGEVTLGGPRAPLHRNKVIVEVRVVFMKIGEIDTLKEQYHADLFIQAKWREPFLDGKSSEELKAFELDKLWNPFLYIENIVQEQKDTTWSATQVTEAGEVYVVERRRVKGVFLESLELNDFPMDVQDLTVTLTSERPDAEIDLIPDNEEMSGINVQTFNDMQEWGLHEHIEITKKTVTQDYSAASRAHPALSVTCRAARRPGYFYYNVFLIMFFITGLSFATFAVKPDLPQNRLQLSFTLLLTSIAFKFVINQMLPKISYLTYMDKYVLMSLMILCIICIWHSLVPKFLTFGRDFVEEVERIVFIGFGSLYVLCHVVFIFWLYFDACKRRRIMKHKDREYKVRKLFYRESPLVSNSLLKKSASCQSQQVNQLAGAGSQPSKTGAINVAILANPIGGHLAIAIPNPPGSAAGLPNHSDPNELPDKALPS